MHNRLRDLHTPSQCQVDVEPFPVIGSKYFHKKVVNEDSFTQCPGEGSQEEVVQQGSDNFAGSLRIKIYINYFGKVCDYIINTFKQYTGV